MADLFLPPMTPIATEEIEDSLTKQTQRINYYATNREFTLQTPLPPQIGLDDIEEDPTLTWVRSLPSPLLSFDEFGEASFLSQGPSNRAVSNHASQDIEGSNFVINSTGEDQAADASNDPSSAETTILSVSNSSAHSFRGKAIPSNSTDKDIVALPRTASSQPEVIDLTGNVEGKKEHRPSARTKVLGPDMSGSKKRLLDVASPVVIPPKRRVVVNTQTPVVDVGEAFSPNERASSVNSYRSTGSDFVLSPSNPLPNHRLTREIVKRYLKRRDETKIIILHAKVVQKSYGSEKRFFCPPPCVRLVGDGWKTKKRRKNASTASTSSPMPSPIANIKSPAPGPGTRASEVCAFIGVGGNDKDYQQLHFDSAKQYAAAKNLHTPDTEKRKHFQLHVKMFYGDATEIGVFYSRPIKVISKPSKKKQTVKNPELCIASGTKVSFFNRLRSQTVSTRYLYATTKGFSASSTQWSSFWIYLVKDNDEDKSVFETYDGYIHYGNPVKLVCSLTGMSLPKMVIRKVGKQDAIIDTDEPISQLHRCAMFLYSTKRQYICVSQDKVIAHTASPNSSNENVDSLNDGSCWTIISTEKAEYCWSDSSLHLSNNIAVSPVPVVNSLQINGGGQLAMVELLGENFTPNLSVWFGIVEADTMYRCEECLLCVVPEINKIKPDWRIVEEPIKVPIVLIRDDGVLYPTHIEFYYMPEPGPKADPHPTIREILRSRKFINNL